MRNIETDDSKIYLVKEILWLREENTSEHILCASHYAEQNGVSYQMSIEMLARGPATDVRNKGGKDKTCAVRKPHVLSPVILKMNMQI